MKPRPLRNAHAGGNTIRAAAATSFGHPQNCRPEAISRFAPDQAGSGGGKRSQPVVASAERVTNHPHWRERPTGHSRYRPMRPFRIEKRVHLSPRHLPLSGRRYCTREALNKSTADVVMAPGKLPRHRGQPAIVLVGAGLDGHSASALMAQFARRTSACLIDIVIGRTACVRVAPPKFRTWGAILPFVQCPKAFGGAASLAFCALVSRYRVVTRFPSVKLVYRRLDV